MPPPGSLDRDDVLRAHGTKHDVLHMASAMGLEIPRSNRIRCPFPGCDPERNRGASVSVREVAGIAQIKCFRCGESGTAIDLVMHRDGVGLQQALETLAGSIPAPRPAPQPHLQLVRTPQDDADKLRPAQVRAIWQALAEHDADGEVYLSGRDLEFRDASVLRFTKPDHPEEEIRTFHQRDRKIAMLLTDVLGQPRGIQGRLVREPRGREPKQRTIRRGVSGRAFFGHPEKICDVWLVCVAEGMADTLALLEWAQGDNRVNGCVVGAAGKENLAHIAEELAANNLDVSGIVFALFPQNDRPENKSRIEFRRLGQLLAQLGAHVLTINTPSEHKDVAIWRKTDPSIEWPPKELADALEFVSETSAGGVPQAPDGQALPVRNEYRVQFNSQGLATLTALLDDPVTRESIIGLSDIFKMRKRTEEIYIGGRRVTDRDITTMRVQIEMTQTTPEGKPLKFNEQEVIRVLHLLASRRQFDPVEEYLRSLTWDQTPRISVGLPQRMGVDPHTLESHFLELWMVQCVRRALDPGCKSDSVLLLVDDGSGGLFKSTFFRTMASDEFFSDSPMTLGDKDGMLICGQKWIIEWPELDAVFRSGETRTKGFITSNQDTFRPPYARSTVTVGRSCVFVGTSNDKRCLRPDGTGLRRWMPIEIRKKIDIGWVKDNRDQLWAEAFMLALNPELHYLQDEYRDVAIAHVAQFEQSDEWTELIAKHHTSDKRRDEYTSADLLIEAIGKPPGQWEQKDQRRIAAACKALGWEKTSVWRNERTVRVYVPKRADV